MRTALANWIVGMSNAERVECDAVKLVQCHAEAAILQHYLVFALLRRIVRQEVEVPRHAHVACLEDLLCLIKSSVENGDAMVGIVLRARFAIVNTF